jgi:hypothetical protein
MVEVPVFVATKIDHSLHNLSAGDAEQKKRTVLGNLPRLVAQAGPLTASLPADDPLVIAGKAVTDVSAAAWVKGVDKNASDVLQADAAFIEICQNVYNRAREASMIVRMFETHQKKLTPEKRTEANYIMQEMRTEIRRVIETVEQLGTVKAVPVGDAARLQIEAAILALEHSIRLAPHVARGIPQGLITRFRAEFSERKATRIRGQRSRKN